MIIFLAALPILVVIALMVGLGWNSPRAGLAGWLVGLIMAWLAFGLTVGGLWISQLKGVYLSLTVLGVLWPALFLYHTVDQAGGIGAIAGWLSRTVADRGLLLIGLAWAFSGFLEGLAGFGVPVAIISPILVGLGVPPVTAVAAVAVGHAWSVTFGDMGVIFQTLTAVTHLDGAWLAPAAGGMLGLACLFCGLVVARLLGRGNRWLAVVGLAAVMAGTQFGLAVAGVTPLAALFAGLAGMVGVWVLGRGAREKPSTRPQEPAPLKAALASYTLLALLLTAIAVLPPLHAAFNRVAVTFTFPATITTPAWANPEGFSTPSGTQVLKPLLHPGVTILLVGLMSLFAYRRANLLPKGARNVLAATWRSGKATSLTILSMVGMSVLMEYTGMTLLLAETFSRWLGGIFPLVSPLVGMLGAFATGSNNNSNVLFAPLQQNVAGLLNIDARLLLAAQTAGGALGSMIAPAKIILGCATTGLHGEQGQVLRKTLPYGLGIGLVLGMVALIAASGGGY